MVFGIVALVVAIVAIIALVVAIVALVLVFVFKAKLKKEIEANRRVADIRAKFLYCK